MRGLHRRARAHLEHALGTAGGMHYLAWPYVEGETLDKYVAREGKLAPELVVVTGPDGSSTATLVRVAHADPRG